ncbi:MAG: MFS transporter [Patescibacteria group bacterium]
MRRTIRLLSLWNFLTDFSLFAPVAVLYFARVSGSFALGMSVFSVIFLTSAIAEVPTGIFSDRIGKKQTMIVGTAFGLLSTIMYAIGLSYWWLILGAILEGTARSFYSGNNDAYLHDVLTDHHLEHEFHAYLGKVSALFQVALAVSALLGGFIAQLSFTLVVWLNVVPPLLKLIVSFLLTEPRKRSVKTTNVYSHLYEAVELFIKNKELRLLSLASMLNYALGESRYQFRAAFVGTLWPVWAIGISAMLSNVGAAVSFYFSGKVISKFKEHASIIGSNIISHAVSFIALLFPTVLSPVLLASTSLLFGVDTVAQSSLFQKHFSEHQRSTMGSLNALGGSLMLAIFAFGLGSLADKIAPAQGLLVFQILALFPTLLFFVLAWKQKSLSTEI